MKREKSSPIPCKLIYPDQRVDLRPSPGEIYDAICIAQRSAGSAVIIERDADSYMRCTYTSEADSLVDVRDGGDRRHFHSASNTLSLDMSIALLTSYVANDDDWMTMIPWEPHTSASVSSPVKRRKKRSSLIERQGKWIFISKHWTLIACGMVCYFVVLLIFLTPAKSPTAFLHALDARGLIAVGTASLILSIFVED